MSPALRLKEQRNRQGRGTGHELALVCLLGLSPPTRSTYVNQTQIHLGSVLQASRESCVLRANLLQDPSVA